MKRMYHVSFSAKDEVLFRDEEDFKRGFNCFALSLFQTDSVGLVEAFMSNHVHWVVQSDDPYALMTSFKNKYIKYFNLKYGRKGGFGEKKCCVVELDGLYHKLAAITYVLRNPVHHGLVPIPFAYSHSTANYLFRKEMNNPSSKGVLKFLSDLNVSKRYRFKSPPRYIMLSDGTFARESVLDIAQVENLYVTVRSFNFYMTRKTTEEWLQEQDKDEVISPRITLEIIENISAQAIINEFIKNESGRLNYNKVTDVEVCMKADEIARNEFGVKSIYQLSLEDRLKLAGRLSNSTFVSSSTLRRCLALSTC